MNNREAYEMLTEKRVHWGRLNDNHIFIWVEGYFTQDFYDLATILNWNGMRMTESEFDRMCGKTRGVFKHKAVKS